jgi:predicted PurR-regulated permease PerM
MNKSLVLASFIMAFILTTTMAITIVKQMALAIDLSSIKQQATNLIAGNHNNASNSNSTSSSVPAGNSSSSSATDSSGSLASTLKQKATNTIGNMMK